MNKVCILSAIEQFVKKNTVMVIALSAAVITMFFVPPDKLYSGYFDFKTLTCLFCVLAVVCRSAVLTCWRALPVLRACGCVCAEEH